MPRGPQVHHHALKARDLFLAVRSGTLEMVDCASTRVKHLCKLQCAPDVLVYAAKQAVAHVLQEGRACTLSWCVAAKLLLKKNFFGD